MLFIIKSFACTVLLRQQRHWHWPVWKASLQYIMSSPPQRLALIWALTRHPFAGTELWIALWRHSLARFWQRQHKRSWKGSISGTDDDDDDDGPLLLTLPPTLPTSQPPPPLARRRFQLILILEHATLCKCPTASARLAFISPPNYWFCSTLLCHSLRSSTLSLPFFLPSFLLSVTLLLLCCGHFCPTRQLDFDCHTARRRLRELPTMVWDNTDNTLVSHECGHFFHFLLSPLAALPSLLPSNCVPLSKFLAVSSRSKLKMWPAMCSCK